MSQSKFQSEEDTLDANRAVHAFLVKSGEYQKSPHFRPENIERVQSVVERLRARLRPGSPSRAIDFGCGTGFMIDRLWPHFDEVHGIDITPEMMAHVDLHDGRVRLHECRAEATPFEDESFDFATAYSFLDHLHDVQPVLAEAHRVLRRGGIFYADLNPNRAFTDAMRQAQFWTRSLPPQIEREIQGALHNGAHYQASTGLDGETLDRAEPGKSLRGGFDMVEVIAAARAAGFSEADVEPHWFLGEASFLHGQEPAHAAVIDSFLRALLPAALPLFKYLRFVFVK
jgi:SAM-dependent methyltransferase